MTNDKLRGLFLALLMILSVFAVAVPASAPVQAQVGNADIVVDDDGGSGIDYQTIDNAISNASQGDVIEVRDGTYPGFRLTKNVTIRGANASNVVIDAEEGTATSQRVINVRDDAGNADGATIANLTVDAVNQQDNTYRVGISVPSNNVTVKKVTVLGDAEVTGIQTNTGSDGVHIDQNTIENAYVGISLQGGPDQATDNTVVNATFEGIGVIAGTGHSFSGNTVVDTSEPHIRYYGGTIDQAAIASLFNSNSGIDTIDNGSGAVYRRIHIGSVYYQNIQKAVDNASADDTIQVGSGTFDGGVTVNKAVTIDGEGPGQTVVSGQHDAFSLQSTDITVRDLKTDVGSEGVRVPTTADASGLTLKNVHITNGTIGMYVAGDTVNTNLEDNGGFADVHLTDVVVKNHVKKGLYIEKLSDATFEGVTVDGVTSPTYGFNNGIDINLKNDTYQNITIRDSVVANVSEGSPYNGVESFSAAIAIKARDDDGKDYGQHPASLDGLTIDNVTVRDSFNGLRFGEPGSVNYATNFTGVTVADSRFTNNDGYHAQVAVTGLAPNVQNNVFDTDVRVDAAAGGRPYPATVWSNIGDAIDQASAGDTVEVGDGIYPEDVSVDKDVNIVAVSAPVVNGRVHIAVDGPTVSGLTIEDPGATGEVEGIFIGDPAGYTDDPAKTITIENVTIRDVSTSATDKAVEGIHVKRYDSGDPIDGVVIANTSIKNVDQPSFGADGIKIQAAVTNVTVRDSTFANINGDWSYGVVATPSSNEQGTPTQVRIIDNEFDGITAGQYSSVAVGIDGSQSNGFVDGRQVFVRDNEFTNLDYGVLNKDDEYVDARYNWWGDPAGPGHSPDVLGNVTVTPWLTAANYVPPTADAGPDKTRTGSGTVTLDGSQSIVATSTATFTWTVDGNTKKGTSVSFSLNPGSYSAILTVDDGRTISAGDSASINVKSPPQQDRGSGERQVPDQSVTSSDGGTSYTKPVADEDPDTPGTDVTFESAEVDGETRTPPVDRISFDKAFGGGTISVESVDTPPEPDEIGEDSDTVVRAFSVDAPSTAESSAASITFSVSQDELMGRSVDDVRLARQTDDGWETFDAEPVGDLTADPIEFRSSVPGFSNWAVVLQRPAGATPTATATPTPEPETTTSTPTPTAVTTTTAMDSGGQDETASPPLTESPGQPGFGIALAVLALVAVALLVVRRRE